MKIKTKIEREFEVGDTFIRENGNALVVKGSHMTLGGMYLTFHNLLCDRLLASHVSECLDDGRWTYLGKVVKEGDV